MSNDKRYFFMFCYTWCANNQSGDGYEILNNDVESLVLKDITDAKDIIKNSIQEKMHHNKESISVIITNIIKLNYCTHDDFYGNQAKPSS